MQIFCIAMQFNHRLLYITFDRIVFTIYTQTSAAIPPPSSSPINSPPNLPSCAMRKNASNFIGLVNLRLALKSILEKQ